LTGDQHTDHISTEQQMSLPAYRTGRHSLPALLYFLFSPPHIFFNLIIADRTLALLVLPDTQAQCFAKSKEPFCCHRTDNNDDINSLENMRN
jgi:hypothetical protein